MQLNSVGQGGAGTWLPEYPGGSGNALGWDLEDRGITHFENMIQYTSGRTRCSSHCCFLGMERRYGSGQGQSLPFRGAVFPRGEERL